VLLHGLLLAIYWEPPLKPRESPVLDVVLETVVKPREQEQLVREVETPEPAPQEPPKLEPLPVVVESVPELEPIEEPTIESVEPSEPKIVLNLRYPENWDALVDEASDPDVTLHFNQDLGQRVAVREAEKRRKGLVDARVAAVYGVADEQYTRTRSLETEIKIDDACYVLAESPGIEDGSRWWRSQCGDTRQNPFTQESVDYDAIGRVVAN